MDLATLAPSIESATREEGCIMQGISVGGLDAALRTLRLA